MIAAALMLCLLAQDKPALGDDDLERETQAELAKVRRIYVDILTGGESALRIRDLLR